MKNMIYIRKYMIGDPLFEILESANMNHIPSMEMPSLNVNNFFVAVDNDHVIGIAGWNILLEKQLAKTTLMVVLPHYRNCGVGYKLQYVRMKYLYEQNIKILLTYSDIDYVISWYIKKFKYKKIGYMEKLCDFGSLSTKWTILKCDLEKYFETCI